MKTLAKGKNSTAIIRLLRVLLQTSQGLHGDFSADDEAIQGVAEVIECDDVGTSNDREGAHIYDWPNKWKQNNKFNQKQKKQITVKTIYEKIGSTIYPNRIQFNSITK